MRFIIRNFLFFTLLFLFIFAFLGLLGIGTWFMYYSLKSDFAIMILIILLFSLVLSIINACQKINKTCKSKYKKM